MVRINALDTETTGVDLRHGAQPFFISLCDQEHVNTYWEWDVNPLTRKPIVPKEDLFEIEEYINKADILVLQNPRFDVSALQTVFKGKLDWDWSKVRDCLLAGHLLASNQKHDLTTMTLIELGIDIKPYENRLQSACVKARNLVRNNPNRFKGWRIAKAGLPEMPSAGGKGIWKYDCWLPRAIAKHMKLPKPDDDCEHVWEDGGCIKCEGNHWWVVLREYGNTDPAVTLALYLVQEKKVEKRKLKSIYKERLRALPVAQLMEHVGVTLSSERLSALVSKYRSESEEAGIVCTNIANSYGYNLDLPKGSNNHSLRNFVFGQDVLRCDSCNTVYEKFNKKLKQQLLETDFQCPDCSKEHLFNQSKQGRLTHQRIPWLDLPRTKFSKKTGEPSLDKDVLEDYELTLPARSKQIVFVKSLRNKRKRDTAVTYLEGYRDYWVPAYPDAVDPETGAGWYVLHPRLNPTGTDTLRWSSSSPNEQNISKKEGFNLRYCFGPAPGREWWSMDAQNIELRIPAYESGEQELIELFERPDEPPYYGSVHLLNFSTVYPDIWGKELKSVGIKKVGPHCKEKYKSTWYQYCKNGAFAVSYGAVLRQGGTADKAFHRDGCHALLKQRFDKQESLNQHWISYANQYGYVETLPDKTVDPDRGYPLLCTRTEYGGILPTIPLNYHVQGSAMWWMQRAMVECHQFLQELNYRVGLKTPADYYDRNNLRKGYFIVMQVHDELVFDFPKGAGTQPWKTNLPKIKKLKRLMEQNGDNFIPRVATPVSVEYHAKSWSEGRSIAA